MTFTVQDACRVQRDLGLLDVHVAYVDLDTDWFVLAHTEAERLAARPVPAREFLVVSVPDPVPLTDCAFYVYLAVGNLDGRLCCTGNVLPSRPAVRLPAGRLVRAAHQLAARCAGAGSVGSLAVADET
jgi:hypothetical protein